MTVIHQQIVIAQIICEDKDDVGFPQRGGQWHGRIPRIRTVRKWRTIRFGLGRTASVFPNAPQFRMVVGGLDGLDRVFDR